MLQRVTSQFSIFCRNFFVSVPKIFAGEPFCAVFQKNSVSEKVYGWEGEYQDFPSKIFCLTVPKTSVGESFSVALISGTEKVWRRGGVWRFYVEKFLSHIAKKFRRGILYCCINFGYRKSLDKRGEYHYFLSKIFRLSDENIRRWTLLSCVSEKFR